MMKFLEEARAYQDSMIQDLRELVKIESVRDDAHATKEAPFGPNIAKCLDKALEIGKRDGFKVENVDGHAGVIQYGDLKESVGVLGHLDVVPLGDGWHFDPLGGEVKDGYIMGRGTCDDKGPAIAAYYAIKILKDKGYKLKYIGGDSVLQEGPEKSDYGHRAGCGISLHLCGERNSGFYGGRENRFLYPVHAVRYRL